MRNVQLTGIICSLVLLSQTLLAADRAVAELPNISHVEPVIDVVLDKHIDPPTRQEMILSGVRAVYQVSEKPLPRGLSRRVSELSSPDEFKDLLLELMAEFGNADWGEDVFMQGMLECVRGGASLADTGAGRVSAQVAANRYVGTGIALGFSKEDKTARISKVFYNGPAWKAGAKNNDLIVEVDGVPISGMQMNQLLEALRGEAGEKVAMLVRQPDDDEPRLLDVTRGRVFLPTVEGYRLVSEGRWKYSIDADPHVALIRFKQIGPSTLHELRKIEATLRRDGVRAVILDLRSGGALLHDVVMVADALIDDAVIGHVRSLDGRKTHTARPGVMFQGMPMAILTSKFTSAGHVFLAAALQDSGRATVFGERTPGNTYVRSLIDIPGLDKQITIATATMERADGTTLLVQSNRRPLSPMVAVETLAKERARRTGFIMPDREINLEGRSSGVNDRVVKEATAILRGRVETRDAQDVASRN